MLVRCSRCLSLPSLSKRLHRLCTPPSDTRPMVTNIPFRTLLPSPQPRLLLNLPPRAIDLGRESRVTEAVQRAASTSALDSIHIAPLAEAHRLYSQASRAFHPERDMVIAPLHTRLIAIASSFKQEQLSKLQRAADMMGMEGGGSSALPLAMSSSASAMPSSSSSAAAPSQAHSAGASTGKKLRKPRSKVLSQCASHASYPYVPAFFQLKLISRRC